MSARPKPVATMLRRTRCDEKGAIPIFEVIIAMSLLLLILVPVAQLLGGLGHTSGQYRYSVVAQNYATAEISQLRAEAAAPNGFPPFDLTSPPAPTGLTSATITPTSQAQNLNEYFGIYTVGGWCTQSTTGNFGWTGYNAVPTDTKQPPAYWVAVVVTWSSNPPGSITTTGSSYQGPFTVSPSPHLVLTGLIATPQGDQGLDSANLPSTCPALLQ